MFGFFVLIGLWCAMEAGSPTVVANPVLFRNVDVLPMDGTGLNAGMDVIVEGGRIRAMVPHDPNRTNTGARVIEGSGKVLMPGLVDMHAHLPNGSAESWDLDDYFARCLAAGVTTVRSMRGHPRQLAWRAEVLGGERLGPHLVLAAPPFHRDQAATADLDVLAERYARAGYDFLKVLSGIEFEQYRSLMETTRKLGLDVTGHIMPEVGPHRTVALGQRTVEHPLTLDTLLEKEGEQGVRKLARRMRENQVFFCPTLDFYLIHIPMMRGEDFAKQRPLTGLPPQVQADWTAYQQEYTEKARKGGEDFLAKRAAFEKRVADYRRLCRILHEEKVAFLVSASAGPFIAPGTSMLDEMKHFKSLGFSNEDVLMAATWHAARALRKGEEFGQVREGRRADLLLLGANPLEDLDALRNIEGVMLEGRLLELPRIATPQL
ncbi:Amidohydrolase family protein [Sulfidibacter corallicola]|uniref:Amidohydrolase family protein n=1 Tax=Sulfidibacter corallicola TaxID=2818388 RepID=A0A8A4TKT5_SULCO|nr:amidohydrolase family protein [Sulfidibacter corallicola]QTD49814.1 amidohydrolase family protein [Sulfidibacter corallicola]